MAGLISKAMAKRGNALGGDSDDSDDDDCSWS
jgi:hypothetical protein